MSPKLVSQRSQPSQNFAKFFAQNVNWELLQIMILIDSGPH